MAIYSDLKPQVLEAVGNGSYLYHYDMTEVDRPAQDGEEAARKTEAYKAFLTERNRLKAQVDSDCAELGIE